MCMYLGLRTNWIATTHQPARPLPLKKFDFPDPFTPTTHQFFRKSLTDCVYSRLEQLWILRSRIAPKAMNNHLFNMHSEIIFGVFPSFGGKQHEEGVSSNNGLDKTCSSTTQIPEPARLSSDPSMISTIRYKTALFKDHVLGERERLFFSLLRVYQLRKETCVE